MVDRARGLDGERGGPARRQRELRRLRGLVDPLDVDRILLGNLHAALEQLDERYDPLIPERQVGEHAGHGPAVRHRAT